MNVQTVTYKEMSFITVSNPAELEVKYLKNNFGFDTLHLDDYINKTQVPKIETFKNYVLLVLDFPYVNLPQNAPKPDDKNNPKSNSSLTNLLPLPSPQSLVPLPTFSATEKKKRILATQVYFFIGKDHLVVLHDGMLSPINDIFSACQKTLRNREEYMGGGPVFLAYRLIDMLVDSCFPYINEIAGMIDRIDKELEDKAVQKTLEDISITRRNIVVFQTMIKPIIPLFRHLEEGKYKELNGDMQAFWSNILDHLQKIWDRLEDSRELIEGISDSNESLLSYRNNELVKFFTIITSVSFPFIIVNNLYSMNVAGLPYAKDPWIVWFLFGLIFVAGVGIILYFKHRRWL